MRSSPGESWIREGRQRVEAPAVRGPGKFAESEAERCLAGVGGPEGGPPKSGLGGGPAINSCALLGDRTFGTPTDSCGRRGGMWDGGRPVRHHGLARISRFFGQGKGRREGKPANHFEKRRNIFAVKGPTGRLRPSPQFATGQATRKPDQQEGGGQGADRGFSAAQAKWPARRALWRLEL